MDTILQFLTGVLRYVLPVLALLILAVCVISLFRNRPRVHKMAQLVDQNNGSVMDITHWETSIGKSKANDVVLPLPSVSRFHAVIAKKKDGWMVTDTFSKNGVQVNGVPVDQRAPLADGDILMIGTIPLQFLCKEAISTDDRSQMRTAARQNRGQTVAYGVLVDAETHRPVYIKSRMCLSAEARTRIFSCSAPRSVPTTHGCAAPPRDGRCMTWTATTAPSSTVGLLRSPS